MSSENYRYYCLDGTGHLHGAACLEAENDEDAVAQIEAKHPDSLCEIWQGQRLVAKLSAQALRSVPAGYAAPTLYESSASSLAISGGYPAQYDAER